MSRRAVAAGFAALPFTGPSADAAGRSDRKSAVRRGLEAVAHMARDPAVLTRDGHNVLWCLHGVAFTSADRRLAARAEDLGAACARRWRRLHPRVPERANIDDLFVLACGSRFSDLFGVADPRMREDVGQAAAKFTAQDFLSFDPAREPPPADVPDMCPRCGFWNVRGRRICVRCGAALVMQSPYDVFSSALIVAYAGERFGVRLGGGYAEVAAHAPSLRPYPAFGRPDFSAAAYAVTHLVYTLNDYSAWRLDPRWLPQEHAFLRNSLSAHGGRMNRELLGEFMDTLKSFGAPNADPVITRASTRLLGVQLSDGSWGDFHPTWTAIDGLRDYVFAGEGSCFPAVLEQLKQFA